MSRSIRRPAALVIAITLLGACGSSSATSPAATRGSGVPSAAASRSPGTSGLASAAASGSAPVASASQAGGTSAGKPPTHVCDLVATADLTALTGGTVSKTNPFVDATFPQCVWSLKNASKVGTAVTTTLVAFAPTTLFDHNDTTGRVDVPGVGDAAYAYPPGRGVLKSSGAELWVKTKGLVMRIYTVPVDFSILADATKTKAWTTQSLALNQAIARLVIANI